MWYHFIEKVICDTPKSDTTIKLKGSCNTLLSTFWAKSNRLILRNFRRHKRHFALHTNSMHRLAGFDIDFPLAPELTHEAD